ncbi:MAG: hypothetical protein LBP76_12730 [Treponema sp.]|jgi:chromosome segregation ATPase|nr:hypothetical protein [Treponema sp.]
MDEQNIPRVVEHPTFESVWAMFQETDRQMKQTDERMRETARQMRETDERMQETDRKWRETDERMWKIDQILQETNRIVQETARQMKETDRQMKETAQQMKETDKEIKEASRIAGNLGNKLGIVVEHLVLANINEKFNALGYEFSKTGIEVRIKDKNRNIMTEVDALLENGEYVLAIEVKTQLRIVDVDEHLERMEKLRCYADARGDTRKFLGAVAGAVVNDNVKVYAQKKGFYVILQSGDTVTIENPAGSNPREW